MEALIPQKYLAAKVRRAPKPFPLKTETTTAIPAKMSNPPNPKADSGLAEERKPEVRFYSG
jgi:hypothetical protein